MYCLEKPAGQLFCSFHSTLGLGRAFSKVMRTVKADMELEKLVQTFDANLEVDRNSISAA